LGLESGKDSNILKLFLILKTTSSKHISYLTQRENSKIKKSIYHGWYKKRVFKGTAAAISSDPQFSVLKLVEFSQFSPLYSSKHLQVTPNEKLQLKIINFQREKETYLLHY